MQILKYSIYIILCSKFIILAAYDTPHTNTTKEVKTYRLHKKTNTNRFAQGHAMLTTHVYIHLFYEMRHACLGEKKICLLFLHIASKVDAF